MAKYEYACRVFDPAGKQFDHAQRSKEDARTFARAIKKILGDRGFTCITLRRPARPDWEEIDLLGNTEADATSSG